MRRMLVLATLVLALAFPAAVAADTIDGIGEPPPAGNSNGMTLAVDRISLTAKVVVSLDLTVSCQPKPASQYLVYSGWENTGLRIWVKQASGRSVASGYADTWFEADELCDGTPHALRATVSAQSSGVPFKNGSAAIAAAAYASYYVENWEIGEFYFVSQSASTGWTTARLTK